MSLSVIRLAFFLAAIMLLAGCGSRAVIHGMVVPPIDGAPASSERGDGLDQAVVFAVPHGGAGYPQRTSRRDLIHTPDGFDPHVLVTPPNTEVEFVNNDTIYHNIFSLTPAKRFDLGSLSPGERRTVHFDSLGVVQVFCELHPETSSFIVVAPLEFQLRPDLTGEFILTGLSAGQYQVTVWHPAYGELVRKVTVPKRGRVELKLAY